VVAVAAVGAGDGGAAGGGRGVGDRAAVGARGGQVAAEVVEAAGVAGALAEADRAGGPDRGAVGAGVADRGGADRTLVDHDRGRRAGDAGRAVPLTNCDRSGARADRMRSVALVAAGDADRPRAAPGQSDLAGARAERAAGAGR